MKPNYRFNQQNQQSYQPSPWALPGYNNSASPWLDYQGGGYRQPYNRSMQQRQRNEYVRRPMNIHKSQNRTNQNKKGPQKRKQNGSQSSADKAGSAKRKREEEEPKGIEMVIVPGEFPPKVMSDEQLENVQSLILQEIDNLADEAFHPQFLSCTKRRGMLVVSCNNQDSVDWLKTIAETLTPWEEAHLKVIEPKDLPLYYTIQIRVPDGTEEPEKLLERLERQNEGLLTKSWHLLNQKTEKNLQMILMSVEEDVIEALKKIDFKPFLNFSRIEIRKLGVMRIGKSSPKPEEKKSEEEQKSKATEEVKPDTAETMAENTETEPEIKKDDSEEVSEN
ncbi:uncharacterized protein [Leptinotarsa decemlineata]|uniref:uncharacterized protein n=1 Tax=Leptinotarsa decemlineata TaxID=7539 RepID=UPI003D30A201